MAIPVIDLFAGPGGLGEGFNSLKDNDGNNIFKIALSIEKDINAHNTLLLRSFFRQFNRNNIPEDYYRVLRKEIEISQLYEKYPQEIEHAKEEAWQAELGLESSDIVDYRIRKALKKSKKWVLIGGPPCQAYSLVGRSRNQGMNPNDPRVYLYREYYRILAVHNPPVFVMENVKGLLSARVEDKLIFLQILEDLKNPVSAYEKLNGNKNKLSKCPGYKIYSFVKKPEEFDLYGNPSYKVSDFIIKAENYGIPQTRHRLILLGIRNDLKGYKPSVIESQALVPISKVLSGLPKLRSGISHEDDTFNAWKQIKNDLIKTELEQPLMMVLDKIIARQVLHTFNKGNEFIKYKCNIGYKKDWFLDPRIKGVCNHSSRSHIKEDIKRYIFSSMFAEIYNKSPKLNDFPISLLPKHKNVLKSSNIDIFSDRFCVQVKNQPSKTITSHISKDGHYYIHPDPVQSRSLSVREAARIQTFPDNYLFTGNRTVQYTQVGNAVPPLLARQIALHIFNFIL